MTESNLEPTDADRLVLLDRLADRIPELDLSEHEIDWTTLPEVVPRVGDERTLTAVEPAAVHEQRLGAVSTLSAR